MNPGDSLEIFVYNDDLLRRLDSYQRTVIKDGLSVACTSGDKIIVFLVNGQQGRYYWSENNSYSYIEGLDSEFVRDCSSSPVSGGICLSSGFSGEKLEVTLTPLMSRIVLRSIRCDFSGRPYEGAKLKDARVYLTNASSVCRVMKTDDFVTRGTLNTGRLCPEDLALMSDPSMLLKELPPSIGEDFVEVGAELYCYPNTNAEEGLGTPFTRLVIEGKLDGTLWYWPINVNRDGICWVEGTPGIDRGKSYVYDITLTRTGTADPDLPVEFGTAVVENVVEDWTVEEERYEVF